jgi:glycosyltransferase involved in cell wall biosynthesis
MLSQIVELSESQVITPATNAFDVSVVVYVDRNLEDAAQMYAQVAKLLNEEKRTFEFIFMDDGNPKAVHAAIEAMHGTAKNVRVIRLPRFYGMSVAMMVGFNHAKGRLILTLGSFLQVQPGEISKLLAKIEEGFDLVNGWRVDRVDSPLNQWHTSAYNWLIRKVAQVTLHDTNCTLKVFKRSLVGELPVYGDNYRFLPVLAYRQGFRVTEVPVKQRREINHWGFYGAGIYLRRFLDLIALTFMGRFVERPLRFFGSIGTSLFAAGFLINTYLLYVKYIGDQPISQRPLLILGTLCMVIGVQSASIGLLGELILFTHSKDMQSYQIEKILE